MIRNTTIENDGGLYIEETISYNSPNWVNSTPNFLRIYATLYYPENITQLSSGVPGLLLIHGLNQDHGEMLPMGETIATLPCVVLMPDLPGMGLSQGPVPAPSNFYYQGNYNASADYYLCLCSAIQGIRVIETLNFVNQSEIAVSGMSYGGLLSMYLGGIYYQHVHLVMPMSAIGEFNDTNIENTLYLLLGQQKSAIPASFWNNQMHFFDPIYYMNTPYYPPICWMMGTSDEIFYYECINGTYNNTPLLTEKYLETYPNFHHAQANSQFTIMYLLNYQFLNGPAPPSIQITSFNIISDLIGDRALIEVNVTNSQHVQSLEIVYSYKDLFADPWLRTTMTLVSTNGNTRYI